ncbi:MAG: hypothetical protein ACRDGG_11430 [Anaerolineae bacterium]
MLAEGKLEEARAKAVEGLAALNGTSEPGAAKAEEDWLRDVLTLSEKSKES